MNFISIFSIYGGIIMFLLILCLHVLIWRVFKPKERTGLLFIIFFVFPAVMFVIAGLVAVKSFSTLTLTALLYFSLAAAYVQTYPAFDVVAPSLKMVHLLYKSGTGLSEEELQSAFDYKDLVEDRIDDLKSDSFIYEKDGFLYLKTSGKVLAKVFYFYRKLYGIEMGEG